jgi:alpha-glucosidase
MEGLKWWQKAVFYQIYPRSFADGNGDGIGDFPGMIARLDHLQSLGVDGLWLSPHFPSPQFDCGYDVSDYLDVAPEYGTLADFKRFLAEAQRRGLRVILDLVLNHTSDQHAWFLESKSSRAHPRRDWYIWRPARPTGSPPNNWFSSFGGSAWEYDPASDSYYYHFFFKQQPDLNWRNPAVKQAMFEAARFWLDLGVDGFRLDAIGTIFEHPDLPDQQSGYTLNELLQLAFSERSPEERQKFWTIWQELFRFQVDQPGVHELMQELRAVIDAYPGALLVGETDDISYYGSGDDELHLVFNFPLMRTERLTPAWVRANQETRLAGLPGAAWPCNTLGNHDSPRLYSRFGDGTHNDQLARQNLLLLLTLKGTPFLYNGEEIGMSDYPITNPAQVRDNLGLWTYRLAQEFGRLPEEECRRVMGLRSRDKNRTPMQWANLPNAGFSPPGVPTWLPVNPDYASGVNVAEQERAPRSLLNFYKAALAMRRGNPALVQGDYQPLEYGSEQVLAYLRSAPEQRCLVLLNMGETPQTLSLHLPARQVRPVFSTLASLPVAVDLRQLALAPFEALIVEIAE